MPPFLELVERNNGLRQAFALRAGASRAQLTLKSQPLSLYHHGESK